jgi:hypothetical protein
MLVPQDQQTTKPASTVSPHLGQIQGWEADTSRGVDKGKMGSNAGTMFVSDRKTSLAGAIACVVSGAATGAVSEPGCGMGLGSLHAQHLSTETSTAAPQ